MRRSLAHLLVCGVLVLSGCPRPRPDLTPPAPVSPPTGATEASRLGPGDVFEVRVYQEADLTGVYRVGPDGTIDFPFCGRLDVRGNTGPELATRLKACLGEKYLRDPQVAVVPREVSSKKISVFGYVQKPGTFPFEDNMTIVQAIALSGGFAQFAAENSTSVIRSGASGDQKFKVPVNDIAVGKAPNFYLQPGDIVFVPESPY